MVVDDGADLGKVVADVVGLEFWGVDLRVPGVVSLSAHPADTILGWISAVDASAPNAG